ncbi:hypothetical protein [Enterobacter hormaechei]|uniref:hypothetical protein n=1 Tax=Enterobacter hormaechei TaxID=158836 RepID=UPI000798B85C|nr:hypothetical protein [Enterobacter hormaechei]CZW99306.1 Uncharacterised protein [Enterobacter hormaechei]
MTTIVIAYDVQDEKLKEIELLLNDVAIRDVNWSGVHFEIERGDFTCIPDDESADESPRII